MQQENTYTLVRKDVRYLRLIVRPHGGLEVVAPVRASLREIEAFIADKQSWVARTRRRMEARKTAANPLPDGHVWLLGEAVHVPELAAAHPDIIVEWHKTHAKRLLPARVRELSAHYNLPIKKVIIRDTRTKWGSCSSLGNIGLNYRLVLLPKWVVDYVILHELAHTVEMNHSAAFWRVVARLCPNYEAAKSWLKANGSAFF